MGGSASFTGLCALAIFYGILCANAEDVSAVSEGYASRGLLATPCTSNNQCNDGSECTKNRCVLGFCDYSQLACSTRDRCKKAACVLDGTVSVCGIVPKCPPSTVNCKVSTCSERGICGTADKVCPPHDSKNRCLASKGCDATTGACTYETVPRVCPAHPTNKCLVPTACDPIKGCSFVAKCPVLANKCQKNVCNPTSGECTPTPIVCNERNKCKWTTTCDPASGCVYAPKPPCPVPANPCEKSVCAAATGTCSTTPIVCNARGPCNVGTCIAGKCSYALKCPKVIPGDLCSIGFCRERTGACYTEKKNCSDGKTCTTDTCNPVNGKCVHTENCRACYGCKNGRCARKRTC